MPGCTPKGTVGTPGTRKQTRRTSHGNPERRKQEAALRAADRDKRTSQEQILLLDARLGLGVGAVKERARLARG